MAGGEEDGLGGQYVDGGEWMSAVSEEECWEWGVGEEGWEEDC